MDQVLSTLDFETNGQGFTDITKDINHWIKNYKLHKGILLIFLKHTSCSLIINENADINVLKDLSTYMKAIVPEKGFYPIDRSDKRIEYLHSEEGFDDMPAHIRTMLTSNNLSFSVVDGKLEIGLWQAIYIWEHRTSNKSRSLQLHAIGDFDLN
ncbi:secondary thiamine-phosphate synthase enzyme YjbQ [Prochlorococcus marinus]|uniref:Secondary thiamine-phosphate synthase enzyme n=1 Tax=Prochlorococcus marinus XMU1408 TaxID=2213228 RepID=A0A318QZ46_PROMR|nr:secondary thiamine-phosphate synthase enzyme YjbQ [Prochlorococcus marinus]MBW3041519.1 secondary thiamine-phosphate synthase enzyme [Prochlorococcus marinus str. XMU1408]PYE02677.1 secondary thiamine-phosphate synthase enzyme [Prochlorococcus marinus XMU1408]